MSKKIIIVKLTMEFEMKESGCAQAVYSDFSNHFNEIRLKSNYGRAMIKGGTGYQITTVSDTYPKDTCWECEKDIDKTSQT